MPRVGVAIGVGEGSATCLVGEGVGTVALLENPPCIMKNITPATTKITTAIIKNTKSFLEEWLGSSENELGGVVEGWGEALGGVPGIPAGELPIRGFDETGFVLGAGEVGFGFGLCGSGVKGVVGLAVFSIHISVQI